MTQYTTQMDAARKGIVTPQIKTVAKGTHACRKNDAARSRR